MAEKIVLGIDFETSGLKPGVDFITEVAYVIKEVGRTKPLKIQHAYLRHEFSGELSAEIQGITKITPDLLESQGQDPKVVAQQLLDDIDFYGVDFMMAHNAAFDEGFFLELLKQFDHDEVRLRGVDLGRATPWICSKEDIDWPYRSTSLFYIGAELGFLNPFPHDALSDVMSMFKCVGEAVKRGILPSFSFMVEHAAKEDMYVHGNPGFHRKEEAKLLGFRWQQVDDVRVEKRWVKKIKVDDFAALKQRCPFEIEEVVR